MRQVRVLSLRIMIVTTIVISVVTTVTVIATVICHYGHRHHHRCQHQPSAGRRGPERSSSRGFESRRTTSSVNTAEPLRAPFLRHDAGMVIA